MPPLAASEGSSLGLTCILVFRFLACAALRLEPSPSQGRILSAFGSGQPRTASETLLSHTCAKSSAEDIKASWILNQDPE